MRSRARITPAEGVRLRMEGELWAQGVRTVLSRVLPACAEASWRVLLTAKQELPAVPVRTQRGVAPASRRRLPW